MISKTTFNFDHRYQGRSPVTVIPSDAPVAGKCRRCGADFVGGRMKKRCDPCQKLADARTQQRSIARQRLKRAADKLKARA
jgi:hypothetical protein